VSTIPQDREDILPKRAFAHIATLGPRGEPQSSPVWLDWDGQHIKFSLTTTRQKYRNLRRDPRVALSIHDPDLPYRYLEVRGKVVRIDEDKDFEFINKMAKKYLDKDAYPWPEPGEQRVVIYVAPEHTTKQ
jgi:PPOX class probable F420-dependent enzyme